MRLLTLATVIIALGVATPAAAHVEEFHGDSKRFASLGLDRDHYVTPSLKHYIRSRIEEELQASLAKWSPRDHWETYKKLGSHSHRPGPAQPTIVPEPAAWLLMILGFVGLGLRSGARKRAKQRI